MSFLGFGHVQEQGGKIFFLPNMNVALRDFIEKSNLEKGREYTVNEFVEKIYENATIALENVGESRKFNLALSNALYGPFGAIPQPSNIHNTKGFFIISLLTISII